MNKKIIIAIIGESGAGKDTFAWALHDFCEWNMVTLTTTRPIRDCEIEDEDYYFIDEDTLDTKLPSSSYQPKKSYPTLSILGKTTSLPTFPEVTKS